MFYSKITSFVKKIVVALVSAGLVAALPTPASATFNNDSILADGRGYGHFAQFKADIKVIGENTWDIDNFSSVSASGDGKVLVASGYVSEPLVYGVYGWTNADTDWGSRDEYDFLLKGDAGGSKNFYFTKISHDGSTVVARADDGIYIWERPVGGWTGEILPAHVQGNSLTNPNYSLSFYEVGWAFEQNIEIAGDGSFLALGANFDWTFDTPVIILNRSGSSWSGFSTDTSGYVRIEAPVVEAANYWGAQMSVNPFENEIAIQYKKNEIHIYDNLGNLVEDGFVVDSAQLTANPSMQYNYEFALVGDTLVTSPFIPNTNVTKQVLIYSRSGSTWNLINPAVWEPTGMHNVNQNNFNGTVHILPDEQTIVVGNYSDGAYILEKSSVWVSISGRSNVTSFKPTLAYYEVDGDVALGGIQSATPVISHPATKPPAFENLRITSTSVKFNNSMVPAIRFDYDRDEEYVDSIWWDALIVVDNNQNAIALAGPGGTITGTNVGQFVAGQTYNVCIYPYTTAAANGLKGDAVCENIKPGGPSKPTIYGLDPVDGGLVVSIYPTAEAPSTAPITGYEYSLDGGITWNTLAYADSQYKITGLTNGTEVDVVIRGKNSIGSGPASDSVAGTPNAPSAATNVTATAGNGSAEVSFTAGTGNYYYKVVANPGPRTCTAYSPNTSCTVNGLTNGTSYTFTVEGYDIGDNKLTTSSASNSVTPSSGGGGSAPAAPTGVTGSAGNGEATVSWTSVSGATSYTVTSNPGNFTCTTSSTSCVVEGLTNGTAYTFTVTASNSNGQSAASSPSASVTPSSSGSAPNAPNAPTVNVGDGRVTVSWSAVSGATSYTVTSDPEGLTCTTSNTSCVITGLTNGVSYTFTVVATNSYGSSGSSNSSAAVTPVAGNEEDEGFENDPKLGFSAPVNPVLPGGASAKSGGVAAPTTQKKYGSSNAISITMGGQNPSSATVRAVLNGTKSTLPLRKFNGIKTLAPEQRSEIKVKLSGYKKGSQVQVYFSNEDSSEVTFLGYARVRNNGEVVKKFRLPAGLNAGAFTLQLNGYGAKTDKVRVNKLSIGTFLVEKAIDRAYFGADSSKLTAKVKAGLENVLPALQSAATVYVYSYTTGDPSKVYKEVNDKIAAKRAEAVTKFLVANGVQADKIVVITVGAVLPRDRSKPWQNRRVDIYTDLVG